MKDQDKKKDQLIDELVKLRHRNAELEAAEIEHKLAKEALQEREEHYKELANSITDVFFAMDKDLKYTYWNRASEELTGISAKDAIGKSLYELFPDTPQTRRAENVYLKAIRTQQPHSFVNEYHIKGKDFFFEINVYPTKEGIAVFTKDITKRRRAKEALKESEERFRGIFENSTIGLYRTTPDGQILLANPTLVSLLGYSSFEELAQRNLNKKGYEPEYPRKTFLERIESEGQAIEIESTWVRRDGTSLFIHESAKAIRDEAGNTLYYEGTVKDTTERKRAEEQREKLQAQLVQSEKMAGIGNLTSGIAHEFNNLLQIMSGHTEYARRTKKPEDMKEALDIVAKTSDRVSKIIKDLLTFSRREPLERKICNIAELVELVLSLTREHLRKHNINIVREYKKTSNVEVNKSEMQQVLLNLVTNARDAMLPKGGRLAIKLKEAKGNVEVSFTDTGIGIEEKNLGRVFEPFYTTKGAAGGDKTQGIGLGLSVSYGIVERHGGSIEVESERGVGTTFTIRLPVKADKVKNRVAKEKRKLKADKTKPINVLVVDDEEEICKMFTKWLSTEGHNVKFALTGKKALNLLKKEYFDIVFLDIVMPGMPAIDAIAEIKEISSKTRVWMITGKLVDKDLWKELKETGASGYIQKPFKIENIKNCLAKIKD